MSYRTSLCVLGALAVALLSVPLLSAEPTAEDVRTAFRRMETAWKVKSAGHRKATTLGHTVRSVIEKPESEYGRLLAAYRDAQRAFMTTFRAGPWHELDTKQDGELLRIGLSEMVDESLLLEPTREAVRAAETLIRRLPASRPARHAMAWRLPVLLTETKGTGDALFRSNDLRTMLETDVERRLLDTWRGDALAAIGRPSKAMASWKAASAAGEKGSGRRLALYGKPLPQLPDGADVGGDVAIAKGRVNVVLFLTSSDYDGLSIAIRLQDWLDGLEGERPNVVGVVHPSNGTLVAEGPEARQGILERTEFRRTGKDPAKNVDALRKSLGISFPFRINADGKWAGEEQHLVRAVVTNRAGRIVGYSGREAHVGLIRTTVAHASKRR